LQERSDLRQVSAGTFLPFSEMIVEMLFSMTLSPSRCYFKRHSMEASNTQYNESCQAKKYILK